MVDLKDTLMRVDRRIDNLAERRGMTRKEFEAWSKRENRRKELTEIEITLLRAYQINKAINKMRNVKHQEELRKKYIWINGARKYFRKVEDIMIPHLIRVCEYWQKEFDLEYHLSWILDLDDCTYYDLTDLTSYEIKNNEKKSNNNDKFSM